MREFDFLVLGSGIAGLFFALKAAPLGRVAIITKKDRAESNTNYAQGGIAAVTSKEDSVELHVRDTLEAGAGLCKEAVVRVIVQEGPARIAELMRYGMQFTEREIPSSHGARELDLGREGGHSKRRILHAKDVTGREVERALLAAVAAESNITNFENHIAIDLITSRKLGLGGRTAAWAPMCWTSNRATLRPLPPPPRSWPPAAAARFISIPPTPILPPATAWPWPIGLGRKSQTWSLCSSTHLPLPSQSQVIPDQRSSPRRGRGAENHRRGGVHGCPPSAEISGSAGHCRPRD
jgi:hypothetical protein